MPLDRVGADQWLESQYMSRLLAVLSGVALTVIADGDLRRDGIHRRAAYEGDRHACRTWRHHWRVIAAIVRRPLLQIGLGIGAGGALVGLISVSLFENTPTPFEATLIAAYALLMLAVCLSACVVPIRRALRLELSQVLRPTRSAGQLPTPRQPIPNHSNSNAQLPTTSNCELGGVGRGW
jgi:hypothetical protein